MKYICKENVYFMGCGYKAGQSYDLNTDEIKNLSAYFEPSKKMKVEVKETETAVVIKKVPKKITKRKNATRLRTHY